MSRLRRRLSALRGLHTPGDVWLFGQVACFGAAVPVLARLPLSRLDALLSRTSARGGQRSPEGAARVARMVDIAQAAGDPVVPGGCLTRGITLYWFLRRAGYPVELCFGVGRVDGDVTGHCWLVLDGQAFLERSPPEERFRPLYHLPAGSLS